VDSRELLLLLLLLLLLAILDARAGSFFDGGLARLAKIGAFRGGIEGWSDVGDD